MANKNVNLQKAKNIKDDEFYTTYETIEKEMAHYTKHFTNKIVLCNCDDPFKSNFCKYFLKNFNILKLKRLICTSYKSSKIVATQSDFEYSKMNHNYSKNGYVLDVTKFSVTLKVRFQMKYIHDFLEKSKVIKRLNGDGDFQKSDECIKYLKISDIIVTNPPFSLFREFFQLLKSIKNSF